MRTDFLVAAVDGRKVRLSAIVLLVQGANLTFLGRREPAIYGSTAVELDAMLQSHARTHDYVLDSTATLKARRLIASIEP
jgi:3-dehydroquinate dehydratase